MSQRILHLLVVEAHEVMREATLAALQSMGHAVRGQESLSANLGELAAHPTDIVVLASVHDEGHALLKQIRHAYPAMGILVVSALGRSRDKVDSYSSGADIYLVKPASHEEIGAAVSAIARRVCPQVLADTTDAPSRAASPYILHVASLQLMGPRAVAHLSDTERHVLSAFSESENHRLSLERLRELSRKNGIEPSKATLEVQVVRLRKKLESIGAKAPTIKAIRGDGYQLCVPLMVQQTPDIAPPLFSSSNV